MSATHVDIIDRTVEKAHVWINDVADELGSTDRHHAYRVLRAFLHAIRDHLPVNEAAALAAQLPIFVRGVFYEGWESKRHSRTDSRPRQLPAEDRERGATGR